MVYTLDINRGRDYIRVVCEEDSGGSLPTGYSITYDDNKLTVVKAFSTKPSLVSVTEVDQSESSDTISAIEEVYKLGREGRIGNYPEPIKFLHRFLILARILRDAEVSHVL